MSEHTDPITGDALTTGEVVSRLIQRVIRRWTFLLTITAITAVVWLVIDPIWHHPPADLWNYCLSWLAIAIESIVGMFFFGQSMRDAVVLRQVASELRDLLLALHEKVDAQATQTAQRDTKTGRYVKRSKSDGAA